MSFFCAGNSKYEKSCRLVWEVIVGRKTTMNRSLPKAAIKRLVLHCMPLMEKGTGSAWGLPVIVSGNQRVSALSLSEKIEAPGIFSLSADPFREEKRQELEVLGIGPLGRYPGGEPIKPIRLKPDDFLPKNGSRRLTGAAELFCTGLEFDDNRWIAEGTTEVLFRGHLEFLRTWGFSGGLFIQEPVLAPLLAEYLCYLQQETKHEKPPVKIIVLVSKLFFETRLKAEVPNAKMYGDPAAGEIPVNYCSGGTAVLEAGSAGLGFVLYEDIAAMLHTQKTRCNILITVRTDSKAPVFPAEISALLKLVISTEKPPKQNNFLFRNLVAVKANESPAAFPNFIEYKTESLKDWNIWKNVRTTVKMISREDAAALDLLSQWETGRVFIMGGCLFAVQTKFSNLRAADFREEQSLYYREAPGQKGPAQNWDPPPIRPGAAFSSLNETQLNYFFRWRSECRRGFVPVPEKSIYIETYIRLYAGELVLCMGREGPLEHFHSLLCLFHACTGEYGETAALLCEWLVDFAVIYGICSEAFPLLLDELRNNGWFYTEQNMHEETKALLIDLAIHYFFIEKPDRLIMPESWPIIKTLVPAKIAARKENNKEFPVQYCHTLGLLDAQLRKDWNMAFFSFFCPPLPISAVFKAFENDRYRGDSSYTVYRPGFSSHKPLRYLLSELALEPEKNPLPEIKTRLHSISLETELLEELRQESDAVREMLKTETSAPGDIKRQTAYKALPEIQTTTYSQPDKKALEIFFTSLSEEEQQLIKDIMQTTAHDPASKTIVSETVIDKINETFYEQFGDLLIEVDSKRLSISSEYRAILGE